ncbi:FKBP-type peptidyl-prolyl cis-trans isomerase [Aquimarina latercula]|uniref:FKBP-type peptidyl-prolyl cis-trans isomerase n=1 Tax=Aquimarina latercula TaxID=987 RepID=UPI000411D5E9|nr:hypothetical protein [Aquimarina latercula]
MNVRKYIFAAGVVVASLYACNNDDDNDFVSVPIRDEAEQQADEDPIIQNYLKTHFFTLVDNDGNPDFQTVQFDTIAGVNSGETSIWDSGFLETKTVTNMDTEVSYTLYLLKYDNGVATERQTQFADSTFVTYTGEVFYDYEDDDGDGIPNDGDVDADGDGEPDTVDDSVTKTDSDGDGIADDSDIDNNPTSSDSDGDGVIDENDPVDNNNPRRRVFDSAVTPVWFDLVNVVEGFREAVVDFKGASGFMENGDGTVRYNMDFGNFTVFMPSGLAYFEEVQNGIPQYAPLIFSVQLYGSVEADHDNDGVPSYLEDIDGDRLVLDVDDDTDDNGFPNYLDPDDDGDGTLTIDEDLEPDTDLTVDRDGDGDPTNDIGDGDPTNDDTDGDGIPNYLDTDDTASRDD